MNTPLKKPRSTALIVWTIPLLALLMAGWMLYKFYADRGGEIVVSFNDGSGLLERKTLLKYKGIVVGNVKKIELHPSDISRVNVTFNVSKNAIAAIARKGNTFWKVKPRITLTEISGLETIVGGVYVEAYPAEKSIEALMKLPAKYKFEASDHKPEDRLQPGLKLFLEDESGSFGVDTPIMYKKFIVGHVIERELERDKVRYTVHIDSAYKDLVKQASHFWGIESINVKAGLSGIKVKVDSLATLVAGGITFDSPATSPSVAASIDENKTFQLYSTKEDIDYDPHHLILRTKSSFSLEAGLSAIYYKGVEAGKIESVTYIPETDTSEYRILLKKSFASVIKNGVYFWAVEPQVSLQGVSGLDAITKGSYIAFEGSDEGQQESYDLHTIPPQREGKKITLHASNISGLKSGAPVFYKSFEAGMISKVALDSDNKNVRIDTVIDPKYASLINTTTLFYKHSAIEAEITFSKVSLHAGTLPEIIQGGISFETLDDKAAQGRNVFTLLDDNKALEKEKYYRSGGKQLTLYAKSARNIGAGTPLLYHQFKAGEVMNVAYESINDRIRIDLYVDKRFAKKVRASSRFYKLSGAELNVAFPKIELKLESLQSLFETAIAFDTPDESTNENKKSYLLYEDHATAFDNAYRAQLYLDETFGLVEGSAIHHKGITIGTIEKIDLENNQVVALMKIEQAYKKLMTADASISLESFKMGLSGIKNPEALVNGSSLHVSPGVALQSGKAYHLQNILTHQNQLRQGLRVVVSADRRSSLAMGSPLFYRQVQIGDIEEVRLSDNATQVEFLLYIQPCYAHLIRSNSHFYNATALGMELSLSGLKIETETLETMISGGIAVVTPDDYGNVANEMQVFKLFDKPQKAWLTWFPKLKSTNPMCQ